MRRRDEHLEEEVGGEGQDDEQQAVLRHAIDHAVDRRRLDQLDADGRAFPHGAVQDRARRRDARRTELGRLPVRLEAVRRHGGIDGQRVAAEARARPRGRELRRKLLAGILHAERTRAAQGDAGLERHARAVRHRRRQRRARQTSAAPRHACSWRNASRHGIHCRSAPSIAMLSVERRPVRFDIRAEHDRGLVPQETPVLVGNEIAQSRLRRHDERAVHLYLCVVDGRVKQAAPALLRGEVGGEIEPRRRDLHVLPRRSPD